MGIIYSWITGEWKSWLRGKHSSQV